MAVQRLRGERGRAVVDGNNRLYRYRLTRDIGEGERSVAIIMLNPSKANHHCDDDSVERCISFARTWGFRTLEVGNLYARYATSPTGLLELQDPIGQPHNDQCLRYMASHCHTVVAAWGEQGKVLGMQVFRNRANHVLRLLWEAMEGAGRTPMIHHLGRTTKGHPYHPGRLPNDTRLREWGVSNPPPQIT